tara:strand:- start:21 stop:194 length:174 start_codon:yes stop_codon:yes gene_type:complete
MRHEETRDNTTAIEATIIEADNRDDIEEDDGQPSEYTEWQDYMGGDEYYDHSENACW